MTEPRKKPQNPISSVRKRDVPFGGKKNVRYRRRGEYRVSYRILLED